MRFHKDLSRDRFDYLDYGEFAKEAEKLMVEMDNIDGFPEGFGEPNKNHMEYVHSLNGAKRLEYYRSHGLDHCDDYPGGDAQFATDVLSGEQRHEDVTLEPLGREDEYIIARMWDERFAYGLDFLDFPFRPEVYAAILQTAGRRNMIIRFNYRYGSPLQYIRDVKSGAYARRVLEDRY